ncbi:MULTISPECIES: hypothetical protein [unclassified Psychrobacillus]|uniref:hypothetical protein n=1 Tax=unclassified Psychrobacillus TaxID=2636677 RepID=UPI0030FA569D
MLEMIQQEFPEIFTKHKKLTKRQPKIYVCSCGNEFNKTKKYNVGGLGFGIPYCEKCGNKAFTSKAYIVWSRMENNQIEEEDFILKMLGDHGQLNKEDLMAKLKENFPNTSGRALGFLVYYGYLNVDKKLRDEDGIIKYSINDQKNNKKRYEKLI